ncbi:BLOC-2 complex member HPS5 isoform X2 [Microcaecilia unicolor]|uniref:Hermansky-Pudlak syndrome 5 protein homolog n=1 Tax=Microcaecilia unicolor TaxID=1415580 RepID=A0A6P7XVG3_9AMPH|nr:Hermansky-Pudlak syndrome 5 protein isoform X2 [Microcaecilia unicolor]
MSSVPLIPESYSHVLAEFESLDPLLAALRLDSSRLKCTCIAVSRKWLALGSSGGGLNLIQKDGWKQRLILAHKEGAISRVSCCPHDDNYVAVATSQGFVVVWELNQERRGKPERVYLSSDHKGRKVTALCWDTAALRIFVGDHLGKVSAIKVNSSKHGKAAAAFVMFPVQIITTIDSRVVQLDYLDGRLLISSLTRSYLCDTEREKFWKIGNKERDGEFGACFFPAGKNSGNQQPLIYCTRPGSRMWEVNFEGEVLSTHQFKQLLSLPPLPIINLNEHCVMSWTELGIYVFVPQSVQVLLWSEVRGIQDISVYKNELFCLHVDGKVSHFSLLSMERCIDRLLKRSFWDLSAKVCCLFRNTVISSRTRKVLPLERLEHLKSQLDLSTQQELISQLEEVISKLEPLDSACSSRRSSISSHESFSVLDSGIYRVISRRGSQSDEESCSIHSQTLSDDERLKEVTLQQEEEQTELDNVSHASVMVDTDWNELLLPFTIPLPFRSTSPLVSLQAMKDSVSSFVRKTTEKISMFHVNPDAKMRHEVRDETHSCDVIARVVTYSKEEESRVEQQTKPPEEDRLQELKTVTAETVARLQDPLVLFNIETLKQVLQEWLPHLEKAFCFQEASSVLAENHQNVHLANGEEGEVLEEKEPDLEAENSKEEVEKPATDSKEASDHAFQVYHLCVFPKEVQEDLAQLTALCLELKIFANKTGSSGDCAEQSTDITVLACHFIRTYFSLLDLKRLKRCIMVVYEDSPTVWETYIQGLKELTVSTPVTVAIDNEDLPKIVKLLSDLEPWDSPLLLAYAARLYEKFGEAALRPFIKFYPSILPSNVLHLCRGNPAHFLAYLDSLIRTKPEEQRLALLKSLLQPESLRLDWLLLAVCHDAPQRINTVNAKGNPRPCSHLFTWGYGQLISLLIKLPASFTMKEKMANICKTYGYWPGYVSLCLELDRRKEAFTNIVYLDDTSLLDEANGVVPETMEEWRFVLHCAQSFGSSLNYSGTRIGNGGAENSCWANCISVENVSLLLAKVVGPDRAWLLLQECGLTGELSERFTRICQILRLAEKRQRAVIQSMLERCERFLWSQQA